ncbi:hypothetical protein [Micromonospora sp. NBRC 101691]|uniref:hypothetical protein n=1 Tax=Micromonospora sp. NBRC 101691 TaxID=3032198 RepID=UPI0024A26E24|nr:hypothetical protein [Micromonospora sp. NBRC 101691]GLY23829.1 hypothetical protein Misp04_35610 [Micromonospora sp. NBRC 101691]
MTEEAGASKANAAETPGRRLVRHMSGRGSARETEGMTTDELMDTLRGRDPDADRPVD